MARAQGARALMALAFETTYGTPPASGFTRMPFASTSLGAEQPLLNSELLGYGRDPLAPIKDAVTADGDVVVPLDAEAFGFWLKAAFGAPTTTGTGPADDATVYDVQMGNVQEGSTVTIKNVVVTSPLTFSGNNMYVQEQAGGAFSGINLFVPEGAPALSVGDVVDVTGTYEEYFDNTQLVVQSMADIVPTGDTAPVTPELLTPADCQLEDWEGVLATVENVTVTVEGMADFWEWEVDGLTMDKQFIANDDWPKPTVGAAYSSLTGPLRFAFDKRRMSPRDLNDIVE